MITDKERLEELKGVVSTWITFLQEGEFADVVDEEVEMIERLISTVEEQAQRLDNMAHVIKLKNKEMRELSNFLKKRNIPLKELSPLITAMKFMEEQQKEIEGRKDFESRRIQQVNNLIERNKHYKQALDAINLLINQDFWNIDELKNGIKQQIEKAHQELEKLK